MELGKNYKNEVVVADDNFAFYLKENYPSYTLISSTTKCLVKKEEVFLELDKKIYNKICLDYNFNKNINFLKNIPEQYEEKIELLVNPVCGVKCPYRKEHYYLNSISHLNYGKTYQMEGCIIKNNFIKQSSENNLYYSDLKRYQEKEKIKIKHFKIEGRTWNKIDLLLTYCDYMIQPKYKNYVISLYYNYTV